MTSSFLQPQLSTIRLPSLRPMKEALRGRRVAGEDELNLRMREEFLRFSKDVYATGTQSTTQK
jgi:hypothetical protein